MAERREGGLAVGDGRCQGRAVLRPGRQPQPQGVQFPLMAIDRVAQGARFRRHLHVTARIVVARRFAGDGGAVIQARRVVERVQGCRAGESDGVAHRNARDKHLFLDHIDIDAVPGAIPVGGEQRVAAVGGIDQEEVVAGGGEGETHVHRFVPGVSLFVPGGGIEVVASHPVQAVRREGQFLPVLGQHRENLVARGQQVFVHQGGSGPGGPVGLADVQVAYARAIRGGEAQGLTAARGIGREPVVGRVQRMRRQAPGLVFQGVEQEEILAGEPLARDDDRVGAEVRHVQGVLGLVHAVPEEPDGVRVRGQGRCAGVLLQRFLETVGPVQAVSCREEGIRLRPEAGGRREEEQKDGNSPFKHCKQYVSRVQK